MHVISGVLVCVSDYSLCDRRKKGEGGGGEEKRLLPCILTLSNAFHAGHIYLLIMSDCLYALKTTSSPFFPLYEVRKVKLPRTETT